VTLGWFFGFVGGGFGPGVGPMACGKWASQFLNMSPEWGEVRTLH
jgi:hypothetical protein